MRFITKKQSIGPQTGLERFIRLVLTVNDTPSLIQQIAQDKFFMKCCAAVAKADPYKAPALWRLRGQIDSEARRQNCSMDRLRKALAPVAAALGLGAAPRGSVQSDYYQVLGVLPDASEIAIKKAFRKRARQVHPDTPNGRQDQFLVVHEAYEILSNPDSRRQYDESRAMEGKFQWVEFSGAGDETHRKKTPSPLRRYGYQLAAVIFGLILISILVDQVIREDSLNHEIYMAAGHSRESGSPKQLPDIAPVADIEPLPAEVHERPVEKRPTKPSLAVNTSEADQEAADPQGSAADDKTGDDEPSPMVSVRSTRKEAQKPSAIEQEPVVEQKPPPTAEKPEAKPEEGTSEQVQAVSTKDKITDKITVDKLAVDRLEISDALNAFLNRYCNAYEAMDLERFMVFFSDSATENGTPVSRLVGQYQENFTQLADIEYQIDMDNYTWHLGRNQVVVRGRFLLKWTRKQEKLSVDDWYSHSGSIKLLLNKKDTDVFRIQQLDYRFN